MNKIILDSTINYQNEGIYNLELEEDTIINLDNSNIKLYLFTKEDIEIIINIKGKVEVYNFTTKNNKITINLEENGSVEFYQMTLTNKEIVNEINVNHNYKETKSNLIARGITYNNGNLKFIINGKVPKGKIDTVCNQSTRIINLNESKSTIEPNLFIDEFKCIANHSAYIGPFDEKILFYLQTKGISKKESFNLLLNTFFKVKELDSNYEEIISKYLNEI